MRYVFHKEFAQASQTLMNSSTNEHEGGGKRWGATATPSRISHPFGTQNRRPRHPGVETPGYGRVVPMGLRRNETSLRKCASSIIIRCSLLNTYGHSPDLSNGSQALWD